MVLGAGGCGTAAGRLLANAARARQRRRERATGERKGQRSWAADKRRHTSRLKGSQHGGANPGTTFAAHIF